MSSGNYSACNFLVILCPASWSSILLMCDPVLSNKSRRFLSKFLVIFFCMASFFQELCCTTSTASQNSNLQTLSPARWLYSVWDAHPWTVVQIWLQVENYSHHRTPRFLSLFLGFMSCHCCFSMVRNSFNVYFVHFSDYLEKEGKFSPCCCIIAKNQIRNW
jgi:hypothetical protein